MKLLVISPSRMPALKTMLLEPFLHQEIEKHFLQREFGKQPQEDVPSPMPQLACGQELSLTEVVIPRGWPFLRDFHSPGTKLPLRIVEMAQLVKCLPSSMET